MKKIFFIFLFIGSISSLHSAADSSQDFKRKRSHFGSSRKRTRVSIKDPVAFAINVQRDREAFLQRELSREYAFNTPFQLLMNAIANEELATVQEMILKDKSLLFHEGNFIIRLYRNDIPFYCKAKLNPLAYACFLKKTEIIKFLLEEDDSKTKISMLQEFSNEFIKLAILDPLTLSTFAPQKLYSFEFICYPLSENSNARRIPSLNVFIKEVEKVEYNILGKAALLENLEDLKNTISSGRMPF